MAIDTGFERLPNNGATAVVGVWKLVEPPVNCTRSIELFEAQAYMVSRCRDPEGKPFGGKDGTRLEKLSATTYRSAKNGIVWEVKSDGSLLATSRSGEVVFRGQPQKERWP
jgi:hypothetical protein